MVDQTLREKLSVARVGIISRHPFIAALMFDLEFQIVEFDMPYPNMKPTAMVNGTWVKFHPEFLAGLTNQETMFVIAHEVMHCALLHTTRRDSRDPMLWNVAGDYVINYLLKEGAIGELTKGGLYNQELYKAGNGTTDGIYDLLQQEKDKQKDQPGGGKGMPELMDFCTDSDGAGDDGNDPARETKWKAKLASAAQMARMAGKLSAGMERLVNDILQPKVDWRSVLAQFTRQAKGDDRSWAKPNRRYMTHNIILPGPDGNVTDDILVAIDCSGSIGEDLLNQFAAELISIQQDTRPRNIHVLYFDSVISHHDHYDLDEEVEVQAHGGGGTAFSPIFAYAYEHEIEPTCCVVLTDLYCSDFGPEPSYPVLWVSIGDDKAPWGRVVKV